MSKMRIHELSKEINVSNKEIIELLKSNGIEVASHMSNIEDDAIALVKKKFAPKQEKSDVKPDSKAGKQAENVSSQKSSSEKPSETLKVNKQEEEKSDSKAETKPESKTASQPESKSEVKVEAKEQTEKKSHITQVYNPQNSGNGFRRNNDRNNGNNGNRQFGDRNSDRNNGNNGNRQFGDRNNGGNRQFGDRNNDRNNGGNRQFVDRNNDRNNGNRQFGDRNNDRNNGGNRQFGDRNNDRNNGGNRQFGDRNNDRNNGNRQFGDRNNGGNNRTNGGNGGRFDRNRGGSGDKLDIKNDIRNDKDVRIDTVKSENRRANGANNKTRERDKDYQEKENLKFINSKKAPSAPAKEEKAEDTIKTLILPDELTIKDLADKMKVQPSAIVKKLFMKGTIVTINQDITFDQAEEIALEFNCICEHEEKVDVIAELLKDTEDPEDTLVPRPPVVCVMGHVDHGKTSLLDAIRSTNVTSRESGGITQHIGAYVTQINDRKITFLDTPGHEAFTAMRMRGAQSTDIAILVVAADDGVMPQTIEAINHAKAAGVEIIVAINKIDKPSANVERVKQELTEYGLISEEWGGSTVFVPVSAHTKEGIDTLLEMIILTADILELRANPNRKVRGLVIEAQLDKGKGPVATVLVQKGTLRVGDTIAAGSCYGKIRAMMDDKGRRVKEALPSTPVEILGLNDVPNAGEIIISTENDKEARNFAETFIREGRVALLNDTKSKLSLDDLFTQIKAGNVKELGIIIKADVQGSVEAVKQSLVKLSNEEVVVKVIHGGVGNINESDVILASASNAIIIGFNVRPDNQAREIAEREKVDLRLYKVIYNAIEDVEAAMKGMLDPTYEERVMGHVEIRQIYKASGVGNIAGSYVRDGKITKNAKVRIYRDSELVFDGELASLKRFKDDVKEVKEGYECGLVINGFNDIKELDIVEAYEMVEVPR